MAKKEKKVEEKKNYSKINKKKDALKSIIKDIEKSLK